jgi:hypothetical protein
MIIIHSQPTTWSINSLSRSRASAVALAALTKGAVLAAQ